eukprot:CAMPEP_0181064746 /NCGR_PEP_ID=MMETSP1070-20121207/24361_1 /TAXON_ID=265543 /ORGANISM="Minutocellus polymorphus, Strain NH13" /LENGTH=585 /DNA_ID=CAMNT_0023145073 /DNA_START=50 /DNA_END=1807 /DNA_ORIENTATION=+
MPTCVNTSNKESDMNAAQALLGIHVNEEPPSSHAVTAAAAAQAGPSTSVVPVNPEPAPSTITQPTSFPTGIIAPAAPHSRHTYPHLAAARTDATPTLGEIMAIPGGSAAGSMTMTAAGGMPTPFPYEAHGGGGGGGAIRTDPLDIAATQVTITGSPQAATATSTKKSKANKARRPARDKFPSKLMEILSNESYADVICWRPHGRSFIINSPERFTEFILPHYSRECKFASFIRKLYRWGFRQISKGPDAESFFHKHFRRDKPSLCNIIVCGKEIRDGCPELHGGINANSLLRLEQRELQADLLQQRKKALARQQFSRQTTLTSQADAAHNAAAAHAAHVHAAKVAAIGARGLPPPTVAAAGYAAYDPVTSLPVGFRPRGLLTCGGGALSGANAGSLGSLLAGLPVLAPAASILANEAPAFLDSEALTSLAANSECPVEVQQRLDAMRARILELKRRQIEELELEHRQLQLLEQEGAIRMQRQQAAVTAAGYMGALPTLAARHSATHPGYLTVSAPAPSVPSAAGNDIAPPASFLAPSLAPPFASVPTPAPAAAVHGEQTAAQPQSVSVAVTATNTSNTSASEVGV